ncbi:MAG TPA: hypothetical protein DCQ28_12100, partial [Bacteroidetes bacterium]|nr:hypothetical protein [Bacteroidota bacterium]
MNKYLFAPIPDIDVNDQREEFITHLKPFFLSLEIELERNKTSRRRTRRRSLKRVMLMLTSEVIGETRFRLTLAFEYFGFIPETIREIQDSQWWVRAKGCKNAGLMLNESALPYLERCLDDE